MGKDKKSLFKRMENAKENLYTQEMYNLKIRLTKLYDKYDDITKAIEDMEDLKHDFNSGKNMLNNIDFICPVKWKGNRQAEYEYEREYSVYDITLRRYDASIEEALSELNEAKNNISQQIDDCKGKIAKTIGLI